MRDRSKKYLSGLSRHTLVVFMFLCILAGSGFLRGVLAQNPPQGSQVTDGMISFDFDNADIRVVIKQISELTGRNFLIDEKVKGNVTIITPGKIRTRDIYQVFLSILHTYGFTAVPAGNVIKILPLRDVSRAGVPIITPRNSVGLSNSDRVVTSFIRLVHADSTALAGLLRPLAAREGSLVAYKAANALIMTDTEGNVKRLFAIIKSVDVPASASEVVVVPMKYAQATEMTQTLEKLIDETDSQSDVGRPRPRPRSRRRGAANPGGVEQFAPKKEIKIIPDERINALIFVAPASDMLRLRSLVKKLDIPPPPERKRIHVYRLKNALAEELAGVLTQQIESSDSSSGRGARPGIPERGRSGRGAVPSPRGAAPRTSSGGGSSLLKDVAITPDKATNSLVVRASPEDYRSLLEIIEKLDVRRSQVLVEALIAEMTLDKTRDLGVEWRIFNQPKSGAARAIGGTNLPTGGASQGIINQFATSPFAGPTGLVLGAARGSLSFNDQTFFDLRGLIRAFEGDTDVNILSTPQILTTDNEEAEIVVGENRPFVTQSQTSAEGSTVQNFEFRDIGVKLRITPHISPNRSVSLKIFQEILSFVEESQVGAVVTTKRQATTSVNVEDGQTVVIGGLIRDDTRDSETKVPFLGDIPILGALFRAQRKVKIKTNLLIFITPRIVTTPEEHRRLTELKKGRSGKFIKPKPGSIKERM
ncbi:MAG: type II secretion system secretin GspD [Nitrospinaceae bacterium]|jgi:general secretion pathway protein D|nr:type II secretion system secretin GspD [Nitrospinaceae bacterium]MBT3432845.1 type II secretion system secretin GspD [Nitrospinaceae bacterium]MBT3821438.1 type II secretion system secretin GspD [Nitrospinaceae bacterium]MBT4094772.1 type II secretion system secretin GspD [Nitrospinaceae bacterium]MBT4430451.1 type II secretion system secretin GspD [Nitrospinaceae bacterium]